MKISSSHNGDNYLIFRADIFSPYNDHMTIEKFAEQDKVHIRSIGESRILRQEFNYLQHKGNEYFKIPMMILLPNLLERINWKLNYKITIFTPHRDVYHFYNNDDFYVVDYEYENDKRISILEVFEMLTDIYNQYYGIVGHPFE